MTKETTTTFYCDKTGDEIENRFDMLAVAVEYPVPHRSSIGNSSESVVHLSSDAHSIEYDRNEHSWTAYVGDTGRVVMLHEESGGGRVRYHGRDTGDDAVADLFGTLDHIIN